MSSFCKRNTYALSAALVAAAFTSLTFAADYDAMTSGSEASASQQPTAPAQENASSAERDNARSSNSMNRGATQNTMMRSERWGQRSSMNMANSGWPSSPNESFPSASGW